MSILFERSEYLGIPGGTRRRLKALNLDREAVRMLRDVLDKKGVKYDSPCWSGEAIAHVGVPSAKVCFYIRSGSGDCSKEDMIFTAWRDQGWRCAVVVDRTVRALHFQGRLVAEVMAALRPEGTSSPKNRGNGKKSRGRKR